MTANQALIQAKNLEARFFLSCIFRIPPDEIHFVKRLNASQCSIISRDSSFLLSKCAFFVLQYAAITTYTGLKHYALRPISLFAISL
jgi:hypothetical protein